MTSLVFDFKDIASRMKGELKSQPEPKPDTVRIALPKANWRALIPQPAICYNCHGGGLDALGNHCHRCNGTGIKP